jgi:hypothetical protein
MSYHVAGRNIRNGAVALLAMLGASPLHGQQPAGLLPDSVAQRAVAFYNLDATTRLLGDARIGPGTGMRGNVALLAGTLIAGGEPRGRRRRHQRQSRRPPGWPHWRPRHGHRR